MGGTRPPRDVWRGAAELDGLLVLSRQHYVPPTTRIGYAAIGDPEASLDWLDQSWGRAHSAIEWTLRFHLYTRTRASYHLSGACVPIHLAPHVANGPLTVEALAARDATILDRYGWCWRRIMIRAPFPEGEGQQPPPP